LTIVHADTPTLLGNLASNNAAAQVAIYMRLAKRLAAAGAGCVVVTSISEVKRAIEQRGLRRIGILGTRTVMETRFYGGVAHAQIIPPSGQDLDAVHQAYVEMAASGVVTGAQRKVFNTVSERLLHTAGVQAIMLGGTDLASAFNEKDAGFPIVDCARIHADAITRLAIPG
jgi:aspartate racemase